MKKFTKILASLSATLVLSVLFSGVSFATSFWDADISTPLTQTSRSFNVQYTTLSTDSTDSIKVDLYQNDVMVATQTTIKPYGDSGAFAVTVPSEGVYRYYIISTNGADSQTSATKQVTVTEPPTVINTVYVTNPDASGSASNSSANNGLAGTSSGQVNGSNQSATTNKSPSDDSEGKVEASGDSTKDNKPSTLGASKATDNNNRLSWTIIGAFVVALLIYANRGRIFRSKK